MHTIGVAFGVPEPYAGVLRGWRERAGDPQAATVPPHITLLPPTEVDGAQFEAVRAHLGKVAARHRPFTVHLRGTGTFRPVSPVVFVAVAAGIAECELVAEDVRSGPLAVPVRFPYHPHVTVAQGLADDRLDAVYEGLGSFDTRFAVEHLTLYTHVSGEWLIHEEYRLNSGK
jgi:2'-5' RNA ligase